MIAILLALLGLCVSVAAVLYGLVHIITGK